MKLRAVCLLGFLVSLALLPSPLLAGSIPGVSFTGVTENFSNGSFSLGYQFSTNTAINVTALGFYDATLTGGDVGLGNCDGCGKVGIYNSSGTLLVSGTATTSGTLIGDFYYVTVPTTNLAAGQTYYVVAETGNADYTWFTTGFSVNPNINFIQDAWVNGSSLTFPTNSDGFTASEGGGIFGANFEEGGAVSATPEPSSILLLGSSLLMAMGALKRKVLS